MEKTKRHSWVKQNRWPIIGKGDVYDILKCSACRLTGRRYHSRPWMVLLGKRSIMSPFLCGIKDDIIKWTDKGPKEIAR